MLTLMCKALLQHIKSCPKVYYYSPVNLNIIVNTVVNTIFM